MTKTARGLRGMVTGPHHLANQAGLDVLRRGGNAIEAMVAAAAAVAVVYPHMTGLGGDGFWLIAEPGKDPVAIDASGPAAQAATVTRYREAGFTTMPTRGPFAALTVPGTIGGWKAALEEAARWHTADGTKPLPLPSLLSDAIHHARDGAPTTASQAHYTTVKRPELENVPGYAGVYLPGGDVPKPAEIFRNPLLAATLEWLAKDGLDDFYRGEVAATLARDLADAGSLLAPGDFRAFAPRLVEPLRVRLPQGDIFNLPPPCQGFASLMILGIFARLDVTEADGFHHIHGLVEATKRAFAHRDRILGDFGAGYPGAVPDLAKLLSSAQLAEEAAEIDPRRAAAWGKALDPSDTIWMGAIDQAGRSVSFIQSLYWEFGSGVVSPGTGIVFQNRGASFALDDISANRLQPGRRPFHTLNPAMARLKDGRTMVYGTMGGDGQPQTQAAVFSRAVMFGQDLQRAVSAPRWLLGRTWGDTSTTLKLERGVGERVIEALKVAGHAVEVIDDLSDLAGHAGAIQRLPSGVLEGAADPRSDGLVAAF